MGFKEVALDGLGFKEVASGFKEVASWFLGVALGFLGFVFLIVGYCFWVWVWVLYVFVFCVLFPDVWGKVELLLLQNHILGLVFVLEIRTLSLVVNVSL